jgi:hypothetical protein
MILFEEARMEMERDPPSIALQCGVTRDYQTKTKREQFNLIMALG